MSKPTLPKSLVSAYFDGEVSAEERAVVTRAAEQTPAVRQMLNDYAQISASLDGLKESVPAPNLREAVLATIRTQEDRPTVQPAVATSRPTRRRWVPMAAGGLTAVAAGLLLMWAASPERAPGLQVADHGGRLVTESNLPAEPPLAAEPMEPAREMTLPADRLAANETHATGPAEVAAALAAQEPSAAGAETPAIPEEWLRQHARDRRTPRPGDMMNYVLQVADETVVIPVTVVDVQRTADQIRVLLASHGIQPLAAENGTSVSPTIDGSTDGSSVAILVESDWEQLPTVMEALDTQGLEVTRYVESSPTARRMIIAQNTRESRERPKTARSRSASSARRTASAGGEGADPLKESSELTEVLRGLFFEAPVTDEFVEQIEQRQHAIADESVLAEGTSEEGTSVAAARNERDDGPPNRLGAPLASEAPARVVFLIKKLGTAP